MVDELLAQGTVKHSKSPYASPAFLVPKGKGEYRLVVDYRKLNAKIRFDSYPLPTIDQAFEQFAGANIFSVLDLNSAYFQIPLSTRSRRITAFCTPFGLYEFCKVPMGISIGSQALSRVIDQLFGDVKGKFVFNFLDDLVVYSKSLEEHDSHLRIILGRLQGAGFTLNPGKITLAACEIQYLGHLISAQGIRVLPDRITAIQNFPPPCNLRSVRRFVGMVGFYARFIPDYSRRAEPLHALKRKGAKFVWSETQQAAFDQLKQALCQAPVLQMPDFSKDFVLSTDASDVAVSAVLQQRIEGGLAPIAFYSRLLSPSERRYSTYEKECLAILMGCERCRSYLEHKEFELECDNLSLCWLLKRTKDVGRLGRWVLRLAPFKFRVRHTRGADNVVADALSRMFEGQCVDNPDFLCASLLEALPLVYSSLAEHQEKDAFCKATRESVVKKEANADKFSICNDRLCYFPRGARRRRWVVPTLLRNMLLHYFHDSMISGHLGAYKTFRRIAANFWWPRMRIEVFAYVRKCDVCQRAKPAQGTAVGLHSASPVERPLERVFIDFVGPLPRTRQGHVGILVVLDGFSKFVNLFPVKQMTSAAVAGCLERVYFPAFGTPRQLVSDNAKVFRCKLFKDLCFRWGIFHITTTPYYPQGSLVERVNRNLKSALKIYHSKAQDKWDVGLPWLATAFNTAHHESTRFTPDVLFLGREIKGPLETRWDLSSMSADGNKGPSRAFWQQAFDHLKRARDRVAERYNRRRREHDYKVGDRVMFRRNLISSKPLQLSSKLMLRWSDPVVIAKFVRANVVLLANPDTGVIIRRAHVSQLKPYVS
jgi:transposase InsO family protein